MEIETKEEIIIDNIKFNSHSIKINIEDKEVHLSSGLARNFATCKIKDIKNMKYGNKKIIKNGKLLLKCNKKCNQCELCKETEFHVYVGPSRYQRIKGYFCGKNKTYAESENKLHKSKIKAKGIIEEEKAYDLIKEKFKRKREKFITDESIKECKEDIDKCLSTQYHTYNEYGQEILMLESMRIRKNKFGYTFEHNGRIGDDGWYTDIYLHPKCNIQTFKNAMERQFHQRVKLDLSD